VKAEDFLMCLLAVVTLLLGLVIAAAALHLPDTDRPAHPTAQTLNP